ncbi:alpha/beta fold hydrolase [Bordetella petrii]|nr:alpha/beta fold hydrolase [Bordetella petrii]
MTNQTCGYAATPGGQVHYAEAGTGAPLLLLHATPRSHRVFRHMLPLLAPHFRAIAVDTPGFGNSAPLPGPISLPALAASLVQLMDTLEIERAHVFGLHTGNKIAAALASDWPDRVGDVILAGQTHSIHADHAERNAGIRDFLARYTPTHASGDPHADALRNWLGAHATLDGYWWPPALLRSARADAAQVAQAEIRVLDYLQGWKSVMPVYDAIFDFDLTGTMQRIAARTLVLELLTEAEAHFGPQGPALCARMQQAHYATLDDANGGVLESRPADVVDRILTFMQQSAPIEASDRRP